MPIQEWSESTLIAEMSDEPLFSEDFDALLIVAERQGRGISAATLLRNQR